MSDYAFRVLDLDVEPYAAVPQLTARLRVEQTAGERVHAIALRSQVRIEPQRRGYDPGEVDALLGLFGGRERWADTLRPFLWMQCSTTVQGFAGSCEVDLPMPCTYDFEVVGSRYLHALEEGTVPLSFLFSGTAFVRGETGFAVQQVPWDCDARYDLPVAVWQRLVDLYFPHTGWIRLDRDLVARLGDVRAREGLTSWEETLERLLARDEGVLS